MSHAGLTTGVRQKTVVRPIVNRVPEPRFFKACCHSNQFSFCVISFLRRNSKTTRDRHVVLGKRNIKNVVFWHHPRVTLTAKTVSVRPSIWSGTEGPRDAKSCRKTRVATSLSIRQQWRGLSIRAPVCYWSYGRTTVWPTYRFCLAFLANQNNYCKTTKRPSF